MIIDSDNWKQNCDNWKKIVIKKIHACNKMNFSSNINEVIRAVLNSLIFFLQKDFACTKKHKKHQKHQKAPKAQKSTKTQPSKNTKPI